MRLLDSGYRLSQVSRPEFAGATLMPHSDYRKWFREPRWMQTGAGPILELPVGIRPAAGLRRGNEGPAAIGSWCQTHVR